MRHAGSSLWHAGSFLVAAHGLLSCGMHVGSSSLTRDRTLAPCIGSVESYPLDHQGSPPHYIYSSYFLNLPQTVTVPMTLNTFFFFKAKGKVKRLLPNRMEILFYFILFIYFWLHWALVAVRGLSLVAASGGYSSLRCVGFSLRWLLLL